MFTGIIKSTGTISGFDGAFLTVRAPGLAGRLQRGQSVAVDGACLTSLAEGGHDIKVEVMPETLERTMLGDRQMGDTLNLELAMGLNDRFEGHLVAGHVDGVGEVKEVGDYGNSHTLTIQAPLALDRYIVEKGSIAVNGVSLTVISVAESRFTVGIIPHTWQVTNLGKLKVGDKVNLETDLIGKYIQKMVAAKTHELQETD